MKEQDTKTLTLKNLTKGGVWDLQENDIIRIFKAADGDPELEDNPRHYVDIVRSAFEIEEIKIDNPKVIAKYEARGMKVSELPFGEATMKWGIKKRAILRVTDLTYENIRHISAAKLLEVIDRNFGGGWDSLSQTIQDIIYSGFDISTTTLPADRLHNPGGMYEKKVADGFEVLEIKKGSWTEAIFAKARPLQEKLSSLLAEDEANTKRKSRDYDGDEDDEDDDDIDNLPSDHYNDDDDDDEMDDDALTAESYRTTIEEDPETLGDITVDDLDDEEY